MQANTVIPHNRRASLMSLLGMVGPYRRDQLRKRLLSAATACREEASSLRRSAKAFRTTTGLSRELITMAATRLPTTPEGWEAEADIFEAMAEIARTYRPTFTN